jgi:hypothetical protein
MVDGESMPMKVTRLTRDMLTLNRMKVNTAKLKPDAIREGAELVRRLTGAAAQPSDQAIVDWVTMTSAVSKLTERVDEYLAKGDVQPGFAKELSNVNRELAQSNNAVATMCLARCAVCRGRLSGRSRRKRHGTKRRGNLLERALQSFIIGISADLPGGFDEPLRLLRIVGFRAPLAFGASGHTGPIQCSALRIYEMSGEIGA